MANIPCPWTQKGPSIRVKLQGWYDHIHVWFQIGLGNRETRHEFLMRGVRTRSHPEGLIIVSHYSIWMYLYFFLFRYLHRFLSYQRWELTAGGGIGIACMRTWEMRVIVWSEYCPLIGWRGSRDQAWPSLTFYDLPWPFMAFYHLLRSLWLNVYCQDTVWYQDHSNPSPN